MNKFIKILYILGFILAICFIIFEVTLLIKYKDTPASELPTWVAWFLFD